MSSPGSTPIKAAIQSVVDSARAYVASRLGETDADEKLAALANSIDALDEVAPPDEPLPIEEAPVEGEEGGATT